MFSGFRYVLVAFLGVAAECLGDTEMNNRRIFGGEKVAEREMPYQAAISINDNIIVCGGAVLNSQYVLTAGHCLEDVGMRVRVGSASLHKRGTWHKVIDYATPFTNNSFTDDIALLRVSPPIKLGRNVKRIRLPKTRPPIPPSGTYLTISGWGLINPYAASSILRKIRMQVMSEENCRSFWPNLASGRICMVAPRPTGTCGGDSGGPLVSEDAVLVGILSYGTKDCTLGYPEIYTPVQPYFSWIMNSKRKLDMIWSSAEGLRRAGNMTAIKPPEVIVLGPGVKVLTPITKYEPSYPIDF